MTRRIDRYELLEEVGSGGMAVVYRGRDTALDREVAVKLLHPHLAARAESRARFSREARAVARLKHPNVVEIYDYAGDAAVESYLVTEFVPGRTLRAFAEEERLGFPEVGALIARALSDALVHAHAAGVIHRDLKPENVLVLESGGRRTIKLVDFGIARILTSDERMTMTGALVGSPNHMAPEIIEGREADERSDVFSVATILYWLTTGAFPFAAPNPTATLRRVIEGDYADPRDVAPTISDELGSVIRHALEVDPARRTATAAELRDDLDRALAASGLLEPGRELQAFLADPPAYKAALRQRLVAAALERAERALAARETARGMKLLDRVLALDPTNGAVAARLQRITWVARWRGRARRAVAVASALFATAVVAWGAAAVERSVARARRAARLAEERSAAAAPGAPHGHAAPSSATGPAPAGTTTHSTPGDARVLAPRSGPEGKAVDPPPPAEAAAAREAAGAERAGGRARTRQATATDQRSSGATVVSVHVRPYAQRALLDGVEVARGEQRVTFRLTRGAPHRIQLEHACCAPFVRDFPATEVIPQPFELKVPLRPLPARLRVEAEPATRIYVDGHLVGTAAESQRAALEVPIPSTGDTPYEATADLRLEIAGRPPVRTALRLRAGAEVTFAAPQEAEPPDATPAGEDLSASGVPR